MTAMHPTTMHPTMLDPTAPDAATMRAALERQQAGLSPTGRVLSAWATFPPTLRPEDWRGDAASACQRLEGQLHHQLRAADTALAAARRNTRSALHELGA